MAAPCPPACPSFQGRVQGIRRKGRSCVANRGVWGKPLPQMRDAHEKGRPHRTRDGVERCHDGRAMGVEVARQGIEPVGLGHHGGRS